MRGLKDPEFLGYLDLINDLDWYDYDLWAVGGIVSDWDTYDIDCIILGEYNEARLTEIITEMRKLGPWSPYYTADENPFVDNNEHRRKMLIWFTDYSDKLIKRWWKWPTIKSSIRKTRGKLNGAPVQLIQNGSRIYF